MSRPDDETTVALLRRAATALESAHEYRVEPEHRPVAAALRARADRLEAINGRPNKFIATTWGVAMAVINAPDTPRQPQGDE